MALKHLGGLKDIGQKGRIDHEGVPEPGFEHGHPGLLEDFGLYEFLGPEGRLLNTSPYNTVGKGCPYLIETIEMSG